MIGAQAVELERALAAGRLASLSLHGTSAAKRYTLDFRAGARPPAAKGGATPTEADRRVGSRGRR